MQELGTIETPIVLTNTLSVGTAVDAVVRWTLAQPGNENVRSVNALVGETNDGTLNDIRGLHVTREHVTAAIAGAKTGAVDEGAVGAGTGHGRVRLERRHRHVVADGDAGHRHLDGRRARAEQLRRQAGDRRRAGVEGADAAAASVAAGGLSAEAAKPRTRTAPA